MLVNTVHVNLLLKEVTKKAGRTLDYANFGYIAEQINDVVDEPYIRKKYLYENVHKQTEKALKESIDQIKLNVAYLNKISLYLGFLDFHDFVEAHSKPENKQLQSCIGNWYSYVRNNSGKAELLIAPVQIISENKKIKMRLKGPSFTYIGNLELKGGCIFSLLESGGDKQIHLVLKIGSSLYPKVLKGIFSSMSTAGDPIGGREILIRQEIDFEALKPRKIPLINIEGNSEILDARIINYFSDYKNNNLKIRYVSTFDMDDLIE